MLFPNRKHVVCDVESAEVLAEKLTQHSWCCCTGFRLGGYLFLNDSTSPDGAQEFAVVREEDMKQIESITFGWCDQAKALQYITQSVAGEFDDVMNMPIDRKTVETPQQHGHCCHCA